jgi:regulator of RNase E activity RraA
VIWSGNDTHGSYRAFVRDVITSEEIDIPIGGVKFTAAPNFTDQGDAVCIRVMFKNTQGLLEIGPGDDIAAYTDAQALPKACPCS